ncbi:MAG TPA: MBG domain-containing protein, partial [Candidatus Paceibacterota bacterium]|nr:MBG domain-containing protein [Candidatus Paceibacterota bacterium]
MNFPSATILTINGAATVNGTVNGATGILKTNKNPSVIDGNGTINSKVTIQQPTSIAATANITTTAIVTLANTLTITSGGILTATEIDSNAKTVANNGTVNLSGNYLRTGGTAIWTQGANSVLNIGGAFTPAANITLNASASGNTINYNGASQTPDTALYANLIFSGSGTVSIVNGVSVSGNLSIAPAGSVVASIGSGLNISVGTLTTGGLGTINGTWGSTASAAANQEDAYFAATTGMLSVATDTRGAQAALTAVAMPATVVYGSTSMLSSTGGSGTGTVTFSVGASTGCSITGGTTLNVIDAGGTCSVTATKAGDKHYNQAISAALPVTLIKKNITVAASASSKIYGEADPAFTYVSSDVSATFSGALSRAAGETPGVYVMTIGSLAVVGNNYNIATFVPADFTIFAAPTAALSLNHPGNMNTGTRLGYIVSRQDQYGNPTSASSMVVYLQSSSTSTA